MKYLLLALLILPLSACFEKEQKQEAGSNFTTLTIQSSDGLSHKFNIELATTTEQQVQGLMHRTELAEDAGMLFFFTEEKERAFWMKNTLISLDLLFIKSDGRVHHIHEKAIPHDLTRIASRGPVAAVLEINGGLTRKLNIKEGDKIKYQLFDDSMAQ